MLIAVSSNFLYPLRNVLGKKAMQIQQDEDVDVNDDKGNVYSKNTTNSSTVNNVDDVDKEQIPLLPGNDSKNVNKKTLDAVEVFYRVSFLSLYLIFPIFI